MSRFHKSLVLAAALGLASAGSALSQTASSGPRVVDANGKAVGTLVGRDEVLVKFADGDALLKIDSFGLSTPAGASPVYYYPTTDCSGPRYARADSFPAFAYFDAYPRTPEPGKSLGGTIYYAKRPLVRINLKSVGLPGACMGIYEENVIVGSVGKSAYVPGYTLPLSIR